MEREVFNTDQAAEFLQTEKRTILNLIHDNKITAQKVGKGYKMHREELVRFLKRQSESRKQKEWTDISYYLYYGISEQLDKALARAEVSAEGFDELERACEVYQKNCLLSHDNLKQKLEQLRLKIKG